MNHERDVSVHHGDTAVRHADSADLVGGLSCPTWDQAPAALEPSRTQSDPRSNLCHANVHTAVPICR